MKFYHEEEDAVHGDLLYAEARKISKSKAIIGSARHKIQKIVLQENAFCVIKKKLRFLSKK